MFENLKKYGVADDQTIEIPLGIRLGTDLREVVLICRTAYLELNRPLYNAMAREASRHSTEDDTVEAIAAGRVRAAAFYAEHVVVGWRNVIGDDGKDVPYSVDAATKFLQSFARHAPHRFIDWRTRVSDPRNFERGFDAERAAGNSDRA